MSDGRTRHIKRCTSHGGRSLDLIAHGLGAVEATGECGELKGHKALTDPRCEGVEPSFSILDCGTDLERHPFDRSVVFRRCRKIEDGAAILPSETTLIVQSAPDVESVDNRRGRHAIRRRDQRGVSLAVSFPTASTALENLAKIDVVRETTGRQRGRICAFSDYLALLDSGTNPSRPDAPEEIETKRNAYHQMEATRVRRQSL
jgi:hypothetical protein